MLRVEHLRKKAWLFRVKDPLTLALLVRNSVVGVGITRLCVLMTVADACVFRYVVDSTKHSLCCKVGFFSCVGVQHVRVT